MSEEMVAAGGHRRWWPDGTMMARLDERTGVELVSLVPGIRYREGSILISQGARDMRVYLLEPANSASSACVKVTACLENGQEALLGIGVRTNTKNVLVNRPRIMLLQLSREMTGAGQNDLENASGWRLLAIGASCCGRGDDPGQAIFGSALATLHALPTSGCRTVTVTVTVQQCSEEARLRGPGLRPDELPTDDLVAERGRAVTEDAAGNLSRSSLGGRRPVGGRDAGANPWPGRSGWQGRPLGPGR
jgi:hypothetical protein